MDFRPSLRFLLLLCATLCFMSAAAQTDIAQAGTAKPQTNFVFGDPLPDAPELAPRGPYSVGVRTVQTVNPDQLDVLAVTPEEPNPRYDRPLTVEVFYPGTVPAGQQRADDLPRRLRIRPGQSRAPQRHP